MKYNLSRDVPVAALGYRAWLGRSTFSIPVDLRDIPVPTK
jgi:hypothetical protein